MDALFSQFTFLSDQALQDKDFDPSKIKDLMKQFEMESHKAWATMELEHEKEMKEAKLAMQQAQDYLDSVMENAMDEFRKFEQEMEHKSKAEHNGLQNTAEKTRKMGNLMEKTATIASKRYIETVENSATSSMKSAWKGLSSNKVYPS